MTDHTTQYTTSSTGFSGTRSADALERIADALTLLALMRYREYHDAYGALPNDPLFNVAAKLRRELELLA